MNTTTNTSSVYFLSYFSWSSKQCLFLTLPLLIIIILIIIVTSLDFNNHEDEIEINCIKNALQEEEYNVLLNIKSTSNRILENRQNVLKNLETIGEILERQEHYLNLQEYYNATCNEWQQKYGNISILGKYNSLWGRYCIAEVYDKERIDHSLLIRDLINKKDNVVGLDKEGIILAGITLTPNGQKNRAVLIGGNGANSIFCREYFAIVNLKDGTVNHIDNGYPITIDKNIIKVHKAIMLRYVSCNADSEYASVYSHYNNKGEPIYLLKGNVNANGYDADGDRISMNIHIDSFGYISGDYKCSGWFSDYELIGKRGSDGVLRIKGKSTCGRSDAEFVFSAPYNGKIEGYCDNGSRKYEITLSY